MKKIWKQAVSMCMVLNMAVGGLPAMAFAAADAGGAAGGTAIHNNHYRAVVSLSRGGGSLSLSKSSDPTQWWNTMSEALVPGATMIWDGAGGFSDAEISVEQTVSANAGTFGAVGTKMGNQVQGVKSWFMFGDEIVCAGAGIRAENGEKLITVVDTIPVDKDTKMGLTNPSNGYRSVIQASQNPNQWQKLLDESIQQKHARNWLAASDLPSPGLQWAYLFGSQGSTLSNENVYCRFNTKGNETKIPAAAELFIAPKEDYQYTMAAGKTTGDYPNSPVQAVSRLITNTTDLQAAENKAEGIVAINKWTKGSTAVSNQVVPVILDSPMSLVLKRNPDTGNVNLTVSKSSTAAEPYMEVVLNMSGKEITDITNQEALAESSFEDGKIILKFDAEKMEKSSSVTMNIAGKPTDSATGSEVTMVRGQELLAKPDAMTGTIDWKVKIRKPDGTFARNAGSSTIKRELKEGEQDGTRTAGDADGSHLVSVQPRQDGALMIAKEKGEAAIVATDENGKTQQWNVTVLYEDPDNLPAASESDYETIRKRWRESLIGVDLTAVEGGAAILEDMDVQAGEFWETYAWRQQASCSGIPWPADEGAAGNPDIAYPDDAVEFRPAFQKVFTMAKSYASRGSAYYQNPELLKDMTNILDWLCRECYTPKSHTDNWWTWEIGLPKDLIPTLVLLYDDLTDQQKELYTEAMYYFQPDPYHEGVIGTASTHAQGYRTAQGANIIDCSRTALGLGIIREDNELVHLAEQASAQTFVIQEVKDSAAIADQGYTSGFYADGSYLDHSFVPYLGSYGIEFLKGGAGLPPLLAGTPWDYPREVQEKLEFYLQEGLLNSMTNGLMLDCLMGRSVSRPGGNDRAAGRQAMALMIQMLDTVSIEVQEELKSSLKAWMEADPGFMDSLTGAENMAIKARAGEIAGDQSISTYIAPMHKSLPLMDRAIHRTDSFLAALSMYSERIQNTEIMNDENRYGWHQGSGMTYIYNNDINQYSDNFWNTVNPLRLAGTTLVSKDIGTGKPDSSGFAQGGDFRSGESWVGGCSIGTDGISGMSLSGKIREKDGEGSTTAGYSPNLSGKKSWFMLGNQIVCLGAGITNSGEDHPVESIIEDRRLREDGSNVLTVNGAVQELSVQEADLKDIVDGKVDVSGTKLTDVSWAHLEGSVEGSSIGYYFPKGYGAISVRKGKNAGDWSLIGTSKGAAEENYLEMWFDHGKNPQNASYEYVLLPGMTTDEVEHYAKEPQVTVLTNTPQVQAVYSESEGILGANFWTDEKTTVADVTADKMSSVMLKEDEQGVLTVTVSDPTMKNKGSIVVSINKPVQHVISSDRNVQAALTKDGVTLTINTKGTNGEGSSAVLQLAASLNPQAVTMTPGQQRSFEVRDYLDESKSIAWRVTGDKVLAPDTQIDDHGLLTVDTHEENGFLTVTAALDNGTVLRSFVSLGGQLKELPEALITTAKLVEQAFAEAANCKDFTDDKVKNAVKSAVEEVAKAPNESLAEYMMNDLLTLEKLYQAVMSANGRDLDSYAVLGEETAMTKLPLLEGAILSIPYAIPANGDLSPSTCNAGAGSNQEVASPPDAMEASPADALPLAVEEAKGSGTKTSAVLEIKNAVPFTGNLPLEVTERAYEFRLNLVHGEAAKETELKAPVRVVMALPDTLADADQIMAYKKGADGRLREIPVSWNKETGRLDFILTENGIITFTGQTEQPEPQPEARYTVTVSSTEGGSVIADPMEGIEGTRVTVTTVPDSGYRLKTLKVDGLDAAVDNKGSYTFTLTKNTTVSGQFTKAAAGDSDYSEDSTNFAEPLWQHNTEGWRLRKANGVYASSEWQQAGGVWYYFNAAGYMATGWLNDKGTWYWLNEDGSMKTGWLYNESDGFWYYLQEDGSMAVGWNDIDGSWYYLSPQTEGTPGWNLVSGIWEYKKPEEPSRPHGSLYTNCQTPDGYHVDENGMWSE